MGFVRKEGVVRHYGAMLLGPGLAGITSRRRCPV
jgi:hypothetical protein